MPNYLSLNVCIWHLYSTAISIKRPRPPFCCHKVIIYCFFSSIKRPANCLFKQNGDSKTIICIKSLAGAINIADQPWHLPCFAVTRTLPYLSERQMTCSSRYNFAPDIEGNRGHLIYMLRCYDDFCIYLQSHMCTFQRAFCPRVDKITLIAISTQLISYLYKRPTSIQRPVFKIPRVAAL